MPRPPTRIDVSSPAQTVIAMGRKTEHWKTLRREFPCVRNCVIDVRRAFTQEHGEDTSGTGFDPHVRHRIMDKGESFRVFEIVSSMSDTRSPENMERTLQVLVSILMFVIESWRSLHGLLSLRLRCWCCKLLVSVLCCAIMANIEV